LHPTGNAYTFSWERLNVSTKYSACRGVSRMTFDARWVAPRSNLNANLPEGDFGPIILRSPLSVSNVDINASKIIGFLEKILTGKINRYPKKPTKIKS
jgi:hypothetical protein